MRLFLILCLWRVCATAVTTDFDCVVVGTSPVSMLEALYQDALGNRVLILEKDKECGGAWKSISVLGVAHADGGCHQIGGNVEMQRFLEDYLGCHLVSLDDPHSPAKLGGQGFYPSQGCYELINCLVRRIEATDIVLLLDCKLDGVYLDKDRHSAEIKTKEGRFTTSKIILTPNTHLHIDNVSMQLQTTSVSHYYHLYLLIEDPSYPKFTYSGNLGSGVSRLMNLSYFSGLEGTGKHLIIIQTHQAGPLQRRGEFFEQLKKKGLITQKARLLGAEEYTYEQPHLNTQVLSRLDPEMRSLVEVLNTSHILSIASYIPKWKQAMKPCPLRP